jgi:uncharacterized protein YcaQ
MEKNLEETQTTHVRAKHLFHKQKQHKGWTDKTEAAGELIKAFPEGSVPQLRRRAPQA